MLYSETDPESYITEYTLVYDTKCCTIRTIIHRIREYDLRSARLEIRANTIFEGLVT